VDLVQSVTGWQDFTLDELMAVGERRINLMRVFNARLGMGRGDDRLPEKFYTPLSGTGPTAGMALSRSEIEAALDEYYRLAGWDTATGNPKDETLERLGIEFRY